MQCVTYPASEKTKILLENNLFIKLYNLKYLKRRSILTYFITRTSYGLFFGSYFCFLDVLTSSTLRILKLVKNGVSTHAVFSCFIIECGLS